MKNLLIVIFFLPISIFAQGWKTYGSIGSESAYSIKETPDGGYVMCGYSDSYGASGNLEAYLIKTDINGNLEWTQTYGGNYNTIALDFDLTSDGGYIITGKRDLINGFSLSDIVLIKADSSGNQQWLQTYGGMYEDCGYSVKETIFGGFIVAGKSDTIISSQSPIGFSRPYIFETDSIGNLQWEKVYAGNSNSELYSIIERPFGYISVGYTTNCSSCSRNFYLLKINHIGDSLDSKSIWRSNDDVLTDITYHNNSYWSSGYSNLSFGNNSNAIILNSNLILNNNYIVDYHNNSTANSITSNENSIIACGTSTDSLGNTDILLMKYAPYYPNFKQIYGGSGDEQGFSCVQTSNNNYVLVGKTETFGYGISDAYLIKTDSNGVINPNTYSFIDSTACDSIQSINGSYYYQTGLYVDTIVNVYGADSIISQDLNIFNSTSNLVVIQSCNPYVMNGVIYDSTGIYNQVLINSEGCDSILTLDYSRLGFSDTTTITSCDSYYWNGLSYDSSGTYFSIFPGSNNCDSVYVLQLTINYSSSSSLTVSSWCSYQWDGITYDSTGQYTNVYTGTNGCDSVVTLDLTINSSYSSTFTVSACDSYYWNGITYNSSGQYTYVYTASNGCDSIVILDLNIYSISSYFSVTACDSYYWNGITYNSSGQYNYVYTTSNGCDSTVFIDLTINYSVSSSSIVNSCDSYYWQGNIYTSTGVYTQVLTNSDGCDSIITLDLTISNSSNSTVSVTYCDSYTWDGIIYYSTGQYTNVYTASNGCDSVVILDLTINSSHSSTFLETTCGLYFWDGNNYTTTGLYTNIYSDINGCDSIVTLDLTVNSSYLSTFTASACDSYFWDGDNYTNTGFYTKIYLDANGCDSIVNLDLTINSVESSSIWQTGNELYAITFNNNSIEADWYNIQIQNDITRIWLMEEQSSSFMPNFDCSYFLIYEDDFGCIDTSSVYYYSENAKRIGNIITSPNPTTNIVKAQFDNPKNQNVKLELINSNGIKLDEFFTTYDNLDIDLSKYPSGTYYLYFNSEDALQGCRLEELQKISSKIILNK